MRPWSLVMLGIAVFGLGAWYAAGVGPGFVFTSGDDFAYASDAIDLSEGSSLVHRIDSPAFISEYVRIAGRPDAYATKYPLGVSLMLAPFYLVAGYRGLFALGPLMAALGVVALYGLAWHLTGRRSVALLAAALLATLPPVVFVAGGIGSDVPSMTLLTAALGVYVRHLRRPRVATFWLCSGLVGASVLVRNPNALLFGVVCVHQLAVHREDLRAQAVAWVGGLLAFGAFVALDVGFNLWIFGSLRGGYEQEIGSGRLSLAYVPHHLPLYLIMLCFVPPVGVVAMLAVTAIRRHERHGVFLMLAGVVLAFVALYSAWGVFGFDYEHAFIGGARFLVPVLPVLCVFVAVAAIDVRAGARLKAALIAVCLLAQFGASGALTYQLRQFKSRMAAHRDLIYSATAQNALVIGPHDWNKLLFARDDKGQVRRYASYETAARVPPPGQEIVRLVEDALRAGAPAYVLGSGSRRTPDEDRAVAVLRMRYRLIRIAESSSPYELSVDQVLP